MEASRTSPKKMIFKAAWPFFYALMKLGKFLYDLGISYRFQMDWGSFPTPEWFDHEYDLAFFPKWRKSHFFERGVYLQEALASNDEVLDLCCGDGSVTALFISPMVKKVVGVDFDPSAISRAQGRYGDFPNVTFQVGDIRRLEFPKATFDAVTWDAAIEHFTQAEMDQIFASIRSAMKPGGQLLGSTIAKQEQVQHHDHEFEFESVGELEKFLRAYFKNVCVWERSHADRRNFYFRCSDRSGDLRTRS